MSLPERDGWLGGCRAEHIPVSFGHIIVGTEMFIYSTHTMMGTRRNETELTNLCVIETTGFSSTRLREVCV